jgi:hypothetical protein
LSADLGSRVLLPVPGLGVPHAWHVGPVRFLPAGAARELIDAMPREGHQVDHPVFRAWLDDRVSALNGSAVAEITDARAQEDALETVSAALAILRAVQHMQNPMVTMRHQAFGLPGDVPSAVVDYVSIGDALTVGAARRGALAGWTFDDAAHEAWTTDPALRFLDDAFTRAEPDRTTLHSRALLAVNLLSQGWLSWNPDVELLNSAMALEVLLGEASDQDKKFRIARRASYFWCGWPRQLYPGTGRLACPLLSLPLHHRRPGAPSLELKTLLHDMRAGRTLGCTYFLDVCDIYDARNEIVHRGQLPAHWKRPDTWFIGAHLLSQVLAWFARHPDAELSLLDSEISSLPTPPP